jgi:hypothetical protein
MAKCLDCGCILKTKNAKSKRCRRCHFLFMRKNHKPTGSGAFVKVYWKRDYTHG